MKVIIITGNELRHRFFAKSLAKELNVVGAIYEKKANLHEKKDYGAAGNKVIQAHFVGRAKSEEKYFDRPFLNDPLIENELEVPRGAVNTPAVFDWINKLNPDLIQLYGSSIIKDHILEKYPNQVINIHLGLSPYYRGSGTNFWPLVQGKIECVGATIHLAVKDVDAGGILQQLRPTVALGDMPHDIGNKTIIAGVKVLPNILQQYHSGKILPQKQNLSIGKVYYKKDLTAAAVEQLYDNFANGLVAKYLTTQAARLNKYPIIEQQTLFQQQ